MTNNQYKKIKVFKSRLKILYGSCNVNEDITNVCPPVMLILPEIWNSWLQKLSFQKNGKFVWLKDPLSLD